uniref:Uncharacterized protein n=1 Tax=Anguilla anguilla TaxID=7936 RepID=A0A0E9TE58_ANGAN
MNNKYKEKQDPSQGRNTRLNINSAQPARAKLQVYALY